MNAFQARMLVEQILAQTSIPAAAQLVDSRIGELDEVFFMVLQQMIQEEQPPELGSWGGSFEDRLAEGLARIQSPTPPSQRCQALQMLQEYAGQQAQAHAQRSFLAGAHRLGTVPPPMPAPASEPPPLPGASGGFDYWLNQLQRMASTGFNPASPPSSLPTAPSEPLDDMGKVRKLMDTDRRYLPLMAEILPGRANANVIARLKEIQRDYQERCCRAAHVPFLFRNRSGREDCRRP